MNGIIGKKIGMTSFFLEDGMNVACTVIEVQPNVVTQVKTEEKDGYNAVQLASFDKREKNSSKGLVGHFGKAGAGPKRKVCEFRNFSLAEEKSLGDVISAADVFTEGDKVQVSGRTKGKGFQGVVKRHNFAGVGDATHGQHNRLRAPGSIGAASYPAKVVKGMKMGGRTGNNKVTTKNLSVVKLIEDENLVLVKGCVPGHIGSFVIIQK